MRKAFLPPIAAALALVAPVAGATAQRTFVSGSGTDSSPCSISAPCRSFTAAIAQVASGGDVVVLDSAGYGPVSVTKSVAITAPPGVYAGITVSSGAGVDIAMAGLVVVLRGLTITGIPGNYGVHVSAASDVTIERCDIASMIDYGIRADATNAVLRVSDTTVRASAVGISARSALTTIERVRIEANTSNGIEVLDTGAAEIRDSSISGNGVGVMAASIGTAGFGAATLDRVIVSLNGGAGVAVYASGGPANGMLVAIANSVLVDNGAEGVHVEATGTGNLARASISETQILRNKVAGVQFFENSTSQASGLLTRNTFNGQLQAVMCVDGFYLSGGGNVVGVSENYSAPSGGGSF